MRPIRLLGLGSAAAVALTAAASAQAAPVVSGSVVAAREGRIVLVSAGGGAARPLTRGRLDHDPAASPDGGRVAFVRNRDLWVVGIDGRGAVAVTSDGRFHDDPAWTPDGRTLAFSSGAWGGVDLATVPASGGPVRRLTQTADHEERHPSVSPDGHSVAFDRSGCDVPRGGGHCVYAMELAGGAPVNLTPEATQPGCERQPGFAFSGASSLPAWSPDGRRIAFTGPPQCEVSPRGTDIWTMDPSGGGKRDLTADADTDDRDATWSPDGAELVFASVRSGTSTLVGVDSAGGVAVPFATGAEPSWGRAVCMVPRLVGHRLAAARTALEAVGRRLGAVGLSRDPGRRGRIADQRPKPGVVRPFGGRVRVAVRR